MAPSTAIPRHRSSIIVLFGTLCKNALPKLDFMRQQKNYHGMHIASSPLLPLPRPLALFTCIFSYTCLCVCVRFRRGAAQKQNNNKKACNFLAVVPLLVCVFVGLSLVLFFFCTFVRTCVCVLVARIFSANVAVWRSTLRPISAKNVCFWYPWRRHSC